MTVEELANENAKLGKDWLTLATWFLYMVKQAEERNTEIERLRERFTEEAEENDAWQKKLAETWAERDQLRAELKAVTGNVAPCQHLHDIRQQEIDRLRAELAAVIACPDPMIHGPGLHGDWLGPR